MGKKKIFTDFETCPRGVRTGLISFSMTIDSNNLFVSDHLRSRNSTSKHVSGLDCDAAFRKETNKSSMSFSSTPDENSSDI